MIAFKVYNRRTRKEVLPWQALKVLGGWHTHPKIKADFRMTQNGVFVVQVPHIDEVELTSDKFRIVLNLETER